MMASCMTLKRSYDHDRESTSNNAYEPRPNPSAKRPRRHFPVTVVSSSNEIDETPITNSSVFPDIQPIVTAGKNNLLSLSMIFFYSFPRFLLFMQMLYLRASRRKFGDFNDVSNSNLINRPIQLMMRLVIHHHQQRQQIHQQLLNLFLHLNKSI